MNQNETKKPEVWSGPSTWPDGTPRPPADDGRPRPPEASPQVQDVLPGYTLPVHRHDRAVDIRDIEEPAWPAMRGKHIVGFSIGATVGATIGALVGSTLAIGGTVFGAILGAAVLGLAFGAVGVLFSRAAPQNDEETYWETEHRKRPYYDPAYSFREDYLPAYEFGYEMRLHYRTSRFDEVESAMQLMWPRRKGRSSLDWPMARRAILDAWDRYDQQRAALDAKPESY